jgi:hypothetical protein
MKEFCVTVFFPLSIKNNNNNNNNNCLFVLIYKIVFTHVPKRKKNILHKE